MTTRIVWLSQTWPIKRRWRLYVGRRLVLSVPLTTVEWSRN